MKKSRLLGAVCGIVFILVASAWTMPSAIAAIVYDFSGECTDVCTGQGTATMVLTDTYIPGTSFTISQFVSMSYSSSSIDYSFSASEILTLYASLMPAVSGAGNVNIDWLQDETGFISNTTEWKSSCGNISLCTVSNGALVDTGAIGTWTLRTSEVPIPQALWLFGSGLLGLVEIARKKVA
jgi:hypothetical protein